MAKRKVVRVKKSTVEGAGRGLFSTSHFQPGDMIGRIEAHVVHDPNFTDPHVLNMPDGLQLKVTCDLKYINHSSTPNASYEPDGTVIAVAEIEPGDELFHDYGPEWE